MEQKRCEYLEQIPEADWDKTPASVKQLVEAMQQRLEKLENQLAEVVAVQEQQTEKLKLTSKNSSSPPSQDPPGFGNKQL